VPCLYLVEAFDDGQKLLEAAERHRLEDVVSKRRMAPYRSGECRDWRKIKALAFGKRTGSDGGCSNPKQLVPKMGTC
jgi:ATP-dependent DNA ligase